MSKSPTTSIFIDTYHPKTDGKCAISIRVTYEGKKRYYPTKYKFTPEEFQKLFTEKPREPYKTAILVLRSEEERASKIIDDLRNRFSFSLFDKKFARKKGDEEDLFALLEERSIELRKEGRIGTAVSYDCCLVSLKKYYPKEKLLLEDVTVDFLNGYKKWMLDQKRSNTTIGIYLRNVRAIYNQAIADDSSLRDLYPFGQHRGKFTIPTGRNVKKALSKSGIEAIYNYVPPSESEVKARDYWIFSYLANGINIKDIALLKINNIDGDYIRFERAKTKRAKESNPIKISIAITPQIQSIIDKWGNKSFRKDSYLFPILNDHQTPDEQYKLVQLFTAFVNNNMKKIAISLEIPFKVTSYVARHSFATVLKRSGVSTEFISEKLGHSDLPTTKNYLADFDDDTNRKILAELTNFDTKLKAV